MKAKRPSSPLLFAIICWIFALFFLLCLQWQGGISFLLWLSTAILKPIFGLLGHFVPFSLFGCLVAFFALLLLLSPCFGLIFALMKKRVSAFFHCLLPLFLVFSFLVATYIPLWGAFYYAPSLASLLELSPKPATAQELFETGECLVAELNAANGKILRDEGGNFFLPQELSYYLEAGQLGYDPLACQYSFLAGNYSQPKPLYTFSLMNYLFIDGIYGPYTVEANVNAQMHPLLLPSTILHEMAHQRGIAPENEANFLAFFVGRNHPDPVFQYSSLCLSYLHLRSALFGADSSLYEKLESQVAPEILCDFNSYYDFYRPFAGKASDLSDSMNTTFLKANGQENGTKSYGAVVDLLIAFYHVEKQS